MRGVGKSSTNLAVEDVVVTIATHVQFNIGGVTAGDLRLGHEESGSNLAVQQRAEPLLLLLLGTVLGKHLHVARVWSSTVGGLAGDDTLAQILGHEAVLQVAEAGALLEVVLGQEHVPQAKLLCLHLQVLNDLRVGIEAVDNARADLLGEDGIGWNAFFLDESLNLSHRD